jgi:phytoene/squalene synthetase
MTDWLLILTTGLTLSSDNAFQTMSSIDHYENFPVASWLCPAHLRPAVKAIYDFARTADDLADEGDAPAHHRLNDLSEFKQDLEGCYLGAGLTSQRWPALFAALARTIQQHHLPAKPLHDLLDAFEQDVVYTSAGQGYRNRQELLDYCTRSANPVGRLMLHLFGVKDAISLAQSDAICTSLQLINLWQDRAQDLARGRDYLPTGHTLAQELAFARELMMQGAPLAPRVKGLGGWELRAVVQGGLCILDKLEAQESRPRLGRQDFARIAWRCWRM